MLLDDFDIKIAIIGSAVGLRGLLELRLFLSDPQDLKIFKSAIFDKNNKFYEMDFISEKKDRYIIKISGVDSRNDAEALKNTELFIKRSILPNASSNEFYCVDLIGMDAIKESGEHYGRIIDVLNFGAGDILEIDLLNEKNSIYHPFTSLFVTDVDLLSRKLIVKNFE